MILGTAIVREPSWGCEVCCLVLDVSKLVAVRDHSGGAHGEVASEIAGMAVLFQRAIA